MAHRQKKKCWCLQKWRKRKISLTSTICVRKRGVMERQDVFVSTWNISKAENEHHLSRLSVIHNCSIIVAIQSLQVTAALLFRFIQRPSRSKIVLCCFICYHQDFGILGTSFTVYLFNVRAWNVLIQWTVVRNVDKRLFEAVWRKMSSADFDRSLKKLGNV